MSFDPITRLSAAELNLIDTINQTYTNETALSKLKGLLQTAVEIELATIPIYLYTYYSLNRTVHSGENIRPSDLFANKAGSMIMSVAVEEMLHMSLSSNILFALGEMPVMYQKAPASYPANLPGHNPVAPRGPDGETSALIPLAGLSFEQLWKFLVIEYPENVEAVPEDGNWDTIGQVYSYIRCLIASDHITDNDFQAGAAVNQIQHYNYAPNNTDTVHVSQPFDPWKPASSPSGGCPSAAAAAVYDNAQDSHAGQSGTESEDFELITISSKEEAFIAIDTICDQGEGFAQPKTATDPEIPTLPTDDPSKSELSHFYKFLTLQAQFQEYSEFSEELPDNPPKPDPILPSVTTQMLQSEKVLFNYPNNPVTAEYPAELQPISDFCNAVFQYMLILTETLFLVEPENQKLFFNEGMHRSMIWVLDKYIQTMRKMNIETGKHAGCALAPTFENIDMGSRQESFSFLKAYGAAAKAAAKSLPPEYSGPAQSIIYYVNNTITATDSSGASMHLPDVAIYWS